MERVLSEIPQGHGVVHLDDLISKAADFESALTNLEVVFHVIRWAGLRLHPKNSPFLMRDILPESGHQCCKVSTDLAKVAALRGWHFLHHVRQLRSFLSLAFYY